MGISKNQVYLLTFLSYTSIHALRTGYSSAKGGIIDYFHLEDRRLMGIPDALMLGFLGLGHFLHAVKTIDKPVKILWISLIICGINYALIPILMDIDFLSNLVVLCVLMSINGYLQSYTWPNLLMLVNSRFDQEKDSVMLSFWATNANFGNIIGYLIFLILYNSELAGNSIWQTGLLITSIYAIGNGLSIGAKSSELELSKKLGKHENFLNVQIEETRHENLMNNEKEKPHKLSVIEVFKDTKITLLTITFSLVKAIIYGIMLWLPLYFSSIPDLKEHSAQIPIAYDIAAIFGSITIGYLFKKVENKGILMIPFMLTLLVFFFFEKYYEFHLVFEYFVIAGIGFSLGGIFNTLSGLVVISLTNVIPDDMKTSSLGFYSALTMAVGNIVTALTQFLIGFIIGKERTFCLNLDSDQIFVLFMVYTAFSLICLIGISIVSCQRKNGEKEKNKRKIKHCDKRECHSILTSNDG